MIEFLGIGAQKAGTTWLTENLKCHPQVWMPNVVKEVHYFDVLHLGFSKKFQLKQLMRRCEMTRNAMKKNGVSEEKLSYLKRIVEPDYAFTDEWYEDLFSAAPEGKVRGEYTPLYCALGPEGIAHVKRLMPNVKLIYIIRDPIQRAMSSLNMALVRGRQEINQQALVKDGLFQARGDYEKNIQAWEQAFPVNQILYIPFGRIKNAPITVLREVETFLGISPLEEYPQLKEQIHATAKVKQAIDPVAVQAIKDTTASQYHFLTERFGADFVAQIA